MIDAEHAGATGYSFDGTNALVLGGTRIDPEFYLAQCSTADATAEAILSTFPSRYQCPAGGEWLESAAQAHEAITDSEDGLWQPIAVAFFGYHLQGREDLAWYFSEEFVEQRDNLAWGVYAGE